VSQEDVEAFKRGVTAYNRGDIDHGELDGLARHSFDGGSELGAEGPTRSILSIFAPPTGFVGSRVPVALAADSLRRRTAVLIVNKPQPARSAFMGRSKTSRRVRRATEQATGLSHRWSEKASTPRRFSGLRSSQRGGQRLTAILAGVSNGADGND